MRESKINEIICEEYKRDNLQKNYLTLPGVLVLLSASVIQQLERLK